MDIIHSEKCLTIIRITLWNIELRIILRMENLMNRCKLIIKILTEEIITLTILN